MSAGKMTCRVCGKEYEPCRSANKNSKVFHWQEVACSPECGAVYLQRINESRGNIAPVKKGRGKKSAVEAPAVLSPEKPSKETDETEHLIDSLTAVDVVPTEIE